MIFPSFYHSLFAMYIKLQETILSINKFKRAGKMILINDTERFRYETEDQAEAIENEIIKALKVKVISPIKKKTTAKKTTKKK